MAKQLKILPEHQSGLYDSETNKDCITEKVVDITKECQKRILLLFLTTKRGKIVQICEPYEGEIYTGIKIHFFVAELEKEMHVAERDDTFGSWAENCNHTKRDFCNLIKKFAAQPNIRINKTSCDGFFMYYFISKFTNSVVSNGRSAFTLYEATSSIC